MSYGDLFDIARERTYPTPYQNSTVLPLLLLSLATQKHSPDTTTRIRREYDYIIVGAGAGGSVVASRLSEIPCVNVLLLEAGDPPPLLTEIPVISGSFLMTDIDWDFLTEPQKYAGAGHVNRQIRIGSGKALGGSSIHNGMLAVRGTRDDYDTWEQLGARGWSWKNVLPYFMKLEDNVDPDIASNGFHGTGGPVTITRPSYNPPLQKAVLEAAHLLGYPFADTNTGIEYGFSDFQVNMRKGQRCSVAKAYLVPSENRTNLDIVSGAFVTKVLFHGKRAVGVQFDHEGRRYEIRAKREVIVSAGTVNTAKLLLLSGIGPRKTLQHFQIPEVADLPVGLNLQDHCVTAVNFVVNATTLSSYQDLKNPRNIELYLNERDGLLAASDAAVNLAFLRNNRLSNQAGPPDHELYFSGIFTYSWIHRNVKPSVLQQVFGPYEKKTILKCMSSLLRPKSRGYVSIRSTDPYYPPVMDPNYLQHPDDVRDVVSGMKGCLRIAATPPMRTLGIQPFETVVPGCERFLHNEDNYLECSARSLIFSIWHSVGTTKMGDPRDRTTVVDPELRVKGIKGLRVIDGSIMPRVPSGNTHLPVIMIAEKASDIIKGGVSCF